MSRSAVVAALAAGVVLPAATGCSHPASPALPPPPQRSSPVAALAAPVDPDPRVGAVFLGATDIHTCAAAVLHSATGDLIVTAAHCLAGGFDTTFVPGFSGAGGPAGTWHVNAVYLDPRWLADRNPLADYAIARVGRDGTLEDAVGPGFALGSAPDAGSLVTVTGYPLGTGGSPIGCRGVTGVTPSGYPSLRCAGLVDGTSGAPWRAGSAVVGVIGGLHGGGCRDNVSYSPPFDRATAQLLARAEAGGPADAPPESFTDDC